LRQMSETNEIVNEMDQLTAGKVMSQVGNRV
jgi:hypothetical protein